MRKYLLLLFLFVFNVVVFGQTNFIIGHITTENDVDLPHTIIINTRTEQKVYTDAKGFFSLSAKVSDELRIVREGYEIKLIRIAAADFDKNIEIKLYPLPKEIEEVKLSFKPTGILQKDVKRLNPSAKVMALNDEMNHYMRVKTEVIPKNNMPSAFKQPDFSAGQMDLVKLAAGVAGLIKKAAEPAKTTANYAERTKFYSRIKSVIDLTYYRDHGMDDYDIDVFIAYADEQYHLSKNYRNNFNKAAIESQLRLAFAEYIKTKNFPYKKMDS